MTGAPCHSGMQECLPTSPVWLRRLAGRQRGNTWSDRSKKSVNIPTLWGHSKHTSLWPTGTLLLGNNRKGNSTCVSSPCVGHTYLPLIPTQSFYSEGGGPKVMLSDQHRTCIWIIYDNFHISDKRRKRNPGWRTAADPCFWRLWIMWIFLAFSFPFYICWLCTELDYEWGLIHLCNA